MNELDPKDNSSESIEAKSREKQADKRRLTLPLGRYFSVFFLFLAISLSSLSLYVVYRLSAEFDSEFEDIARAIETRFSKEEKSIDGINARIFSIEESLLSRISQLEGRVETGEDRLEVKIGELDSASVGAGASHKHIQFLLMEAQRALYWYRDIDHAVRLLRDVERLMGTKALGEYRTYQDTISDQVLQLESSEVHEFSELFVKLNDLADLVDGLEVLSKESLDQNRVEEYDGYWDEFKGALDQLVRIRAVSRETDRFNLMNAIDLRLLKLEWKLYVQEMRLTVLNQDQHLYLELVKRFENDIVKIKPAIPALDVFRTQIEELRKYDVSPLSSDIDEISKRIQKISEGAL